MIAISVDGESFKIDLQRLAAHDQTFSVWQVVSLVRAQLPADQLIIQVALDDAPLSEDDWEQRLTETADAQIVIHTAPKFEHLTRRLESAEQYLKQIINEFSRSAQGFKTGDPATGNAGLASAVDNFLAYVHWYTTLLILDRTALGDALVRFHNHVETIHAVCEELASQQAFSNDFALGAILEVRLTPALVALQAECAATTQSYHRA